MRDAVSCQATCKLTTSWRRPRRLGQQVSAASSLRSAAIRLLCKWPTGCRRHRGRQWSLTKSAVKVNSSPLGSRAFKCRVGWLLEATTCCARSTRAGPRSPVGVRRLTVCAQPADRAASQWADKFGLGSSHSTGRCRRPGRVPEQRNRQVLLPRRLGKINHLESFVCPSAGRASERRPNN